LFPSLADAGYVYVGGIGHSSSNDVDRGRIAGLVMEGIEELALKVVSGFIIVCCSIWLVEDGIIELGAGVASGFVTLRLLTVEVVTAFVVAVVLDAIESFLFGRVFWW